MWETTHVRKPLEKCSEFGIKNYKMNDATAKRCLIGAYILEYIFKHVELSEQRIAKHLRKIKAYTSPKTF
jgi:hypothetical protein